MSCVEVGLVKSQSVSTTRVFTVPFLTNSLEVDEGEELILEVREKTKDKVATKRTWKDDVKNEERSNKVRKEQRVRGKEGRIQMQTAVADREAN